MNYGGIWLAYGANAIPFLLIMILICLLKGKPSLERLLCLDKSVRNRAPKLDISINARDSAVTGISQRAHSFLQEEGFSRKTAYLAALCIEELAADFVAHTHQQQGEDADRTIMDIKLFADEDSLQIIIRNAAAPYNPLDFDLDDETFGKVGVKMVQKLAQSIQYNYVYRMNIITIRVDK